MIKLYRFKAFSYMRMIFYMIVFLFLIIQPVDFMDHISLCPFYNLFGYQCLFCGMTRACIHLLHFDFLGAFIFHPFSFVVFPLLCLCVIFDIYSIIKFYKIS